MSKVVNIWEHKHWGDNIHWKDWSERKLIGFSKPNEYDKGTEFRDKMMSGKIARFKVMKIKYESNPPDMFTAEVKDIGYVGEQ